MQSSSAAVSTLTVTATKIPTLVTNFSVSGTDQNRTLTITPNATTFGTNTLTITVSDGIGSVTTNITLAVTHVNQSPTIALSTNTVTTVAGLMTTNLIVATVADPDINFDANAIANLHLSATSSDSSVVAPAGVFFTAVTVGGDKRAIAVIPAGAGTGTATLTIKVDDGALTNSATMTVTVLPVSHPLFANTNTISAPAAGNGGPTIVIPANTLPGLVAKATVTLNGLKGVVPGSSTFTLTAPGGATVPLIQNSGPGTATDYGQLLFADGAVGTLPASNNETNTVSLAPVTPLSALTGINANGTWTLTVQNGGAAAAQLIDGWTLNLFSAPTISTIANVSMPEETTQAANFTVASLNGTVTNVTGRVLVNPNLAKITGSLNGNNATLTIQGNFNRYGTNTVEVVATDNSGFTGTNTFTLAVSFVDHAPTWDFVPRQVTTAGSVLGPINIVVTDVDLPPQTITVHANSDNTKLIPDSNLVLKPTATPGTYTLTIFPVGTVSGTANITLSANDGLKTGTALFQVFVQDPGVPLFAVPSSVLIVPQAAGIPYPSTNTVSGLLGNIEKVQVTLFDIDDPTPGGLTVLLEGPAGQKVILMAGAGGNNLLTNTTIVFDDAGAPLPQATQIDSGIFAPTTFGAVASLPIPAPAAPYATTLGAFGGTNPNGVWKLYVADTTSGPGTRGSVIAGGWQLSIQTTPSIAPIKDQLTDENVTARVTITVGDNQPGVNTTVTATGDPTLFQSITSSGTGASRTLTIVPVPFKFGTNTITVTATDPLLHTSTATFSMGIRAVAQPPLFTSTPADQTLNAATQLPPVSFRVWPPQATALTVTASSQDNPALVPSVQVTQTGTDNGTNIYSLTLIPAGVQTGTATITIVASDNTTGAKSTTTFKLTVNQTLAFANTNVISIPLGPLQPGQLQQGVANPYPSVVSVKGLGGLVSSVQVTLVGLTHPFPSDLDILVVSPDNSKAVMLMAHAGSGSTASGLRLTFKDGAPAIPPSGALGSQNYSPANYASGLVLPSPAPAITYSASLAAFNGISPNGDWKLYVLDDLYPDGGSIDNGWLLFLQTAPSIAAIGGQATLENTPLAVPLSLSDSSVDPTNLVVTVVNSLDSPPDLATNFVITGTGTSRYFDNHPDNKLPVGVERFE